MMDFAYLTPNVTHTLIGIFSFLVFATAICFGIARAKPSPKTKELVLRTKSWWIILGLLSAVIIAGPRTTLFFFAFVSFLALKEFLSIIPTRRADRRVLFWMYLSIPMQFWTIGVGWYGLFIVFIPVFVFLFLPLRMVMIGATDGFLKAVGTLQWGLMITVFSLGHLAYLVVLPEQKNPMGGGAGLVLFIILLTELNDVAQFTWGKLFGRRKIIPKVSPNKTWEGFFGGLFTTALLGYFISPYLTPIEGYPRLWIGALIAAAGFVGDVTISSVKRDIHLKDSGNILPGHGGILDRIDSLCYTAPVFFHTIYYLYY